MTLGEKETEVRQALDALLRSVRASARMDALGKQPADDAVVFDDTTLHFAFEVANVFSQLDEYYSLARGEAGCSFEPETFTSTQQVYTWLDENGYTPALSAQPLVVEQEIIYWVNKDPELAPVMTRRNYVIQHVELFAMVGGKPVFSESE